MKIARKELFENLAIIAFVGNLGLFAYNVNSTNKIDNLQRESAPHIAQPAVMGEIEKAYEERYKVLDKLAVLTQTPYSSNTYSNHLANIHSNEISQLVKGIEIMNSDIDRMRNDPSITQYNIACEARHEQELKEQEQFIKFKQEKKLPCAAGGLLAFGALIPLAIAAAVGTYNSFKKKEE